MAEKSVEYFRSRNDFGHWGDPRFPSPRKLRTVCAFAIDLVLPLATFTAIAVDLTPGTTPHLKMAALLPALALTAVLSFTNRVILQRLFRTSIGKALFGLCVISRSDGDRPKLGQLAWAWLAGIGLAIGTAFNVGVSKNPTLARFPIPVRRRDLQKPT
jgi:hypothetical protein